MPTSSAGKNKFYCKMYKQNKTHDTEDCFKLKRRAKHAKSNTIQNEADNVTYKDLNAFVNAKRKEKEVKINAFNKFCSLNVESSNKEGKLNKHAITADNDDGSNTSCLLSNDSNSDVSA
eukprot:15327347-Ditylum_brightwellii.AAC.1